MSPAVALGIDVGGTTVKLARIDAAGQVTSPVLVIPTDRTVAPSALVQRMADEALEAGLLSDGLTGVGVGLPGLIQFEQGIAVALPNIPEWNGFAVRDAFAAAFGLPAAVDNDANLAALAEAQVGIGRATHGGADLAASPDSPHRAGGGAGAGPSFVLVALGTGVGGAIVLGGQVWRGQSGLAGELGHIKVVPASLSTVTCGCGARGCLETFLGGAYLADAVPGFSSAADLAQAARGGDTAAQAAYRRAGEALGQVVQGLLLALDLDDVVFVGGGAAALDLLEPAIRAQLRSGLFGRDPDRVRLSLGVLGDRAPLVGAGLLGCALATDPQ
jgi:glucokinase